MTLVFLSWAWSDQAARGRAILDSVIDEVPVIIGDADRDEAFANWLTGETRRTGLPLHGGGHGSLLFVKEGLVQDWIPRVHECSPEDLRRAVTGALAGPGAGAPPGSATQR